MKVEKMTATSTNNSTLNTSAEAIPFPDLAKVGELNGNMLTETAKFNAQIGAVFQNLGKEWSEFIGMRLHEDMQLVQTIHGCRSLPDLQQAYAQFWQNAFTQYGEETQRILRITQGAVEETAHAARERVEDMSSAAKARAA